MGITNLLKQMKDASLLQKHHISSFSGGRLAVDASSWLYKSAYSCAERLNGPNGEQVCKDQYCGYMIRRIESLLYAGVSTVTLVFDGVRVPMKKEENENRKSKRRKALEEGRRLRMEGRHREADRMFQSTAFTSRAMAENVAEAIRRRWGKKEDAKVTYLFSPYEADAQLVSLVMENKVDAVITEDADIMVYSMSSNTPFPIIFKLDKDTLECDVIDLGFMMPKSGAEQMNMTPLHGKDGAFSGCLRYMMSQERKFGEGRRMFVQACILSGCDYVESLPGCGCMGAFKEITKQGHRKGDERVNFFISSKKGERNSKGKAITKGGMVAKEEGERSRALNDMKEYEELVAKAEAVFFYHKVYKQGSGKVENLQKVGGEGMPVLDRWEGKEEEFMGDNGGIEDGKGGGVLKMVEPSKGGGWMLKLNSSKNIKKEKDITTANSSFAADFNLGDEDDGNERKKGAKTPKRLERRKGGGKGGFMKGGGKAKAAASTTTSATLDKDDLMSRFFGGGSSMSKKRSSPRTKSKSKSSLSSQTQAPLANSTSQESDSDGIDSPVVKRGPKVMVAERFRAAVGRGWDVDGKTKSGAKKKIGLMERFGFKKREMKWEERMIKEEEGGGKENIKAEWKDKDQSKGNAVEVICVDSPLRRSPRKNTPVKNSSPRKSPRKHNAGSENDSPNVPKAKKTGGGAGGASVEKKEKKKSKLSMSLDRFKFGFNKKKRKVEEGEGKGKKKARVV